MSGIVLGSSWCLLSALDLKVVQLLVLAFCSGFGASEGRGEFALIVFNRMVGFVSRLELK